MKKVFILSVLLVMTSSIAFAHGGRTRASDGCHKDVKAGTEHCH